MAKFPTPDQVRRDATNKLRGKIADALERGQLRVDINNDERWVLNLVLQDLDQENWHGELEPDPLSMPLSGEPGVILVLSEKSK